MSIDEDKEKNLLDDDKGELEMSGHISLDVDEPQQKNTPKEFDGILNEKESLENMGFPRPLIDKIYSVMHPANIEEALDYLNKNDKDKFTHSYIPNASNVCSICGYKRSDHQIDDLINAPVEKKEEKKEEKKLNVLDDDDLIKDNDYNDDDMDEDIRNMMNKYKNKFNNNYYEDYNYKYESAKECGVCMETIESKDIPKIKLPCKHYFCIDCWKEYLKEKINNANVYKLTCMQSKCNYILEEKFIKAILDQDVDLQQKYDKFLNRKKLMDSNKKIKFCPFPDCDGYAEKKFKKYVKCNNGHEFCFECGAAPHGLKACSKIIDEGFEEWKSHTLVKRCPNCKFWTEKNEGCNHMTCSQCRFQWCWVCEKECVAGHYEFGPCKGLHFERVNNDEDAKRLMRENCDCCCVIGWLITNFIYLLIYLFMMPCFYLAVLGFKYLDDYNNCGSIVFYSMSFLPFFICYEILFTCYIIVFTVIGFFIWPLHRFLKNMLFGKILGELFPV
jgi:hypothetical protein